MNHPRSPLCRLLTAAILLAGAGGCAVVDGRPPTNQQRADRLANGVVMASGGAAWPSVRTIAFTRSTREGDAVRGARTHVWDVRNGTDTVSVGDRTTTINLNNVDQNDPVQADALAAWREDTAWLLAPLRLFDRGVRREYLGRRDVAGKSYEVLQLSSDDGGPIPGGQQTLYVDPYTSLVAFSEDSTPTDAAAADDSAAPASPKTTWEQYRHKQGLVLSTHHRAGPRVITIDDLSVGAD